MDPSRLPEASRRRAQELNARSPLEAVTDLASAYLADADGLNEVIDHIRRKAAYNVRNVRREIAVIQTVLAEPQAPDALARVVGCNGNWALDDPSDAGAAAFLTALADHMRAAVAVVETARRS
jgi:hypothetical protein